MVTTRRGATSAIKNEGAAEAFDETEVSIVLDQRDGNTVTAVGRRVRDEGRRYSRAVTRDRRDQNDTTRRIARGKGVAGESMVAAHSVVNEGTETQTEAIASHPLPSTTTSSYCNSPSSSSAKKSQAQKKDASATSFSHLHGSAAEDQKRLVYNHLFSHSTMVTPVPVIDNEATDEWPKIISAHVLVDPFIPSNHMGGPRPGWKSSLREKKLVVVSVANEASLSEFKDVMAAAVTSGWTDTDQLEIKFAFDAATAVAYSKGTTQSRSKQQN